MKIFPIVIIASLPIAVVAWLLEPTGWLVSALAALIMSVTMMHYAVSSILAISYRKKLYDLPGGRRIHTTPTPRLGGLAFAPIVFCTTILALSLHGFIAPEYHSAIPDCLLWMSALIFIHMTGTVDDLIGVRYYIKLLTQIIAALLIVTSGFWINDLGGLFGIHELSAGVGMPLTVLFIIGIVNAFNLIDGLDGLAAGLCIIALSIYGVYSFMTERYFFSLVIFSSLGTVIPFFHVNVYGFGAGKRKLFMGDTGSQALGLIISVLAVGLIMNNGTALAPQYFILALSPMVIPVFDVAHVVFFRMLKGHHPFHPDTTHIHHRLMKFGFGPRKALVLILLSSAAFVGVNLLLARYIDVTWILLIDIAVWFVLNGAMRSVTKRKMEVMNAKDSAGKSKKNINAK